ncbi:response regulator transcription factor [Bailinhaonella thermotolerans]|uniref:DNA-binding response regulator n=1 Tax=Bailinhaonella thermotolerans TaxID=1070861 RepID=A0A3A4AZ74_9ACTN|nr:response regulator transcription factor [Bailinhaonella thermotolerans]RJL30520.1 DNA-binding response regulator [Bailinhaonella thermotolerans]
MIRVVLADDQELVRSGLRALLERDPAIEVVAEAADGREALRRVADHLPDVVLMDIRMPGLDGLEATRRVAADPSLRGVHVVVLTTFDEDENVIEAIRRGAAGFLLKDITPDELRRAVHAAATGEALLSPSITRRVMTWATSRPATRPELLSPLTDREREVLHHIGLGESNDELARALHISPATARTYVSRLLTKLRARDRSQLVVLAYESGLITPGA